jgi:putative ABC transport system substrate-binding protein
MRRREVVIVTTLGAKRLEILYPVREHSAAGGLISYGTDRNDACRQVGAYAGHVLEGERPADLPVVVNLRTAKALGLATPASLLALTDEVTE